MTRREMLTAGVTSAALLMLPRSAVAAAVPNPHGKRGLGATPTGFGARLRANAQANPPVDPIDYYHSIGLGGAEVGAPPATLPRSPNSATSSSPTTCTSCSTSACRTRRMICPRSKAR